MKWISVKDRLPKPSTAMETHRVLVWIKDKWHSNWIVGWYIGGHLNEWRIEGSPNRQDGVLYWAEVQPPKTNREDPHGAFSID